jgi:ParB family chromosome partitioning protein
MLRLLQLPAPIRSLVQSSSLSLGHARALLSLQSEPEMMLLAKQVVAQGMSVREVERRVRDRKPTPKPMSENRTVEPAPVASNQRIRNIEDQLRKRLQTDVRLNMAGTDKGSIAVSFYNAEDLERLLDIMLGVNRERH